MPTTQPAGYLAQPSSGTGSPILVLHPWWGLNDTIKGICNRLAEAGFIAFAPDLYHGKVTDQISEAETLSGAVFQNLEQTQNEVVNAAKFLAEYTDQSDRGIAVIGFSLGAFFALDLSLTLTDLIHSVVIFYGTRPGDYSASKAAYLGHFAEQDEFEPQEEVNNLRQALKDAGRPFTFYQYDGTGHWFFEPDRLDAYNGAAAQLAWDRTLAFLNASGS